MKNIRIFLAFLLIMMMFAFVGCGTYNGNGMYTDTTSRGGIVNDVERGTDDLIDRTDDLLYNNTTGNGIVNNTNNR